MKLTPDKVNRLIHDAIGQGRLDPVVSTARPVFSAWIFYVIIGVGLLLIGLVMYFDSVFGNKTLLYGEFGGDSLNEYYPTYVVLSDCLHEGRIPSWSFRVGMGQNIFGYVGTLVLTPVVWLPKSAIATALVYQHLLYIVIAGITFGVFLANRGLGFTSCLLGALFLSFSAYMCAGSCWYPLAAEVVCMTLLLLACELAVGRGHWLYVTLAVVLVGFLGSFYLYLGALLLCSYVPFRLIERNTWQPIALSKTCIVLALAAFLGVGLGAIVSIDNFYSLLNSPRGSGLTSMFGRLSSRTAFAL